MDVNSASRRRLQSLDVLRGLTIIGMISANYADDLSGLGYRVFPQLLHTSWQGFHIADSVFPAFVTMTGVSLAVAGSGTGLDRATFRQIALRSLRLLLLGLVVSNVGWLLDPSHQTFRPEGVLQRIAVAYFGAAVIYRGLGARWSAIVAAGLLLLYWPLTLIPCPDGVATNLLVRGANFSSWFDRAVLGVHIYVPGPSGFDPEGLLGDFSAIAQALIGALLGRWLITRGDSIKVALSGLAMVLAGLGWGLVFPIVKGLWTSSFVLLSTGITILLLALFHWWLDERRLRLPGTSFLTAFGINSIFAYGLHQLFGVFLSAPSLKMLSTAVTPQVGAEVAALLPIAIVVGLMWIVLGYMRRRHWIVKV